MASLFWRQHRLRVRLLPQIARTVWPRPVVSPNCYFATGCAEPFTKGLLVYTQASSLTGSSAWFKDYCSPAGSLGLAPAHQASVRWSAVFPLKRRDLPQRTLSMGNQSTWSQHSASRCSQEPQSPESGPCPPRGEGPEWRPEGTAGRAPHSHSRDPGLEHTPISKGFCLSAYPGQLLHVGPIASHE